MGTRKPPFLGRLAVQQGLLTREQLIAALDEHERAPEPRRFGAVLVKMGLISQPQLVELVNEQNRLVEQQRARKAAAGGQSAPAARPQARAAEATPSAPARPMPAAAPSPGVDAAPSAAAPSPSADEAPAAAAPPPSADAAPAAAAPTPSADAAPAAAAPTPSADAARPDAPPAPEAGAPPQGASPDSTEAPAAGPALRVSGAPRDPAALDGLLRHAVEKGASDVHIHSGAPLQMRLAGALTAEGPVVEPEKAEGLLLNALSAEDAALLQDRGELDICHSIPGVGRFRANFYRQQAGLDGVFRFVPPSPPSLEDLGLPETLEKFTDFHQGMVLITGPTGCGKTSTMAAMLNLLNERRPDHILTVEDPIEYVHESKKALVNQRSVERHTGSFARALRAALREDPDVIVIGELRDLETISLALTAAETGHFVLATLHTGSSIRTINRLVGAFPSNQQDQVRTMLSESLRAVISQRMIPRADGQGRVAALETLVVNRAVANLIRENKTFQIHSILQTGAKQGMITLDQSVRQFLAEGVISEEEARRNMEDTQEKAA
jgi:twitching motility protein PilT